MEYEFWSHREDYVQVQLESGGTQSVGIGQGINSLCFPGYNFNDEQDAFENNQSTNSHTPFDSKKVIGSIADEKNDKFYFFARNSTDISPSFVIESFPEVDSIATPSGSLTAQQQGGNPGEGYVYTGDVKQYLSGTGIQVHSDSIVEWDVNKKEHKIVFTDNHTLTFPIWSIRTGKAANYGIHPYSSGGLANLNAIPPLEGFYDHGIGDENNHTNGLVRDINVVMDEYLANKFLQVGTHVECWAVKTTNPNTRDNTINISPGATITSFRKYTVSDVDSPDGIAQGAIAGSTKLAGYVITLSKEIDLTLAQQHPEFLIFKLADSALGLSDEPLTGINIIDDLLFFTNGKTEPKKINIPRCIKGTQRARYSIRFDGNIVPESSNISYGSSGSRQTLLIVEDELVPHYSMRYDTTIDGPILDDDYYDVKWLEMSARHTNVIKKKPITKIKTKIATDLRSGPTLGNTEAWTFYSPSNVQLEPGTTGNFEIYIPSNIGGNSVGTLAYEVGDVILLLNEADINETTRSLPFNYDVRLLITSIGTAPSARYYYEVLSVGDNTPVPLSVFHTTLETPDNAKYADEMLRFSYRYKYEDRETSAFAPFSDIVFLPGEFKYDNSNVFNAGMENYISKINLEDFIYLPNISDVVGIDILLKYESSPNIYVVETIRRQYITENLNPVDDIASVNFGWLRGSYKFDIDSLKFILPENQLLRSWDNVPTSALAQEIVGNRIVYANYTQSYDISDRAQDSSLLLGTSARKNLGYSYAQYTGSPSVKSQRNYQVGISWIDKEGRESPVITSDSSLIYFNKSLSNVDNLISITNNSIIPDWARAYKYYVKDPKKPNYNFVIDTVYLAETGEYWLSVPSSERNKVEEGDYLEIKKGVESNVAVSKQSEAKIIAIENEAPDFIKTRYRSLGKCKAFMPGSNVPTAGALFNSDDEPVAGKDHFKIYKYTWENELDPGSNFGQGVALAGEGAFDNPEMAVRFVATPTGAVNSNVSGNYRSDLYQVASLTTTGGTAVNFGTYTIKLEKPISENDSWVEDTTNPGNVEPTLKLEVFERIIESLPEHEGRFFAKIQGKDDIVNDIVGDNYTFQNERILHEFPIRNLTDFGSGQQAGLGQGDHTTGVALINPNGTPGFTGSQNTTSNLSSTVGGMPSGDPWMTDTYADADSLFRYTEYGINNILPDYWFIDRMRYQEIQNKNLPGATQYGGVLVTNSSSYSGKRGYGMGIFKGTADHEYVDPTLH